MNKSQSGFTLIELLVIATIGVLITIAAINLFFSTILSGGKSLGLNEVKQNGDYAVTQIERLIRNAKSIDVGDCLTNSLTVENFDGTLSIINAISSNQQLAVNGVALTSANLQLTEGPTFNCDFSTGAVPPIVDFSFTLRKGDPDKDRASDVVVVGFSGRSQLRQY